MPRHRCVRGVRGVCEQTSAGNGEEAAAVHTHLAAIFCKLRPLRSRKDQRHALFRIIVNRHAIKALEAFGILYFTGFLDRTVGAFHFAKLTR